MLSGFETDRKRVERVWGELKRRYPLLGARVHESEEKVSFVVSELKIASRLVSPTKSRFQTRDDWGLGTKHRRLRTTW